MRRLGFSAARMRPLAAVIGRSVFTVDLPVDTQRRRLERFSRTLPPGRGVRAVPASLGGVPCERIAGPGGMALLYLHGGAYAIGSARTHRGLAGALARALGAQAWIADYRLSPEHPSPAALEDALIAYRALLASGVAPAQLIVAGDSAGGGLTLALAMALRDAGGPLPASLGLLCPWLDLAADAEGPRAPAPREPLLTPEVLTLAAREYAAGADVRAPGISPLFGDLRGLPPMVVSSAADDLLIADADGLAARAAQAGARLTHQRHVGVWHAFQAFAPVMPQAAFAIDRLGAALLAERQEGRGSSVRAP